MGNLWNAPGAESRGVSCAGTGRRWSLGMQGGCALSMAFDDRDPTRDAEPVVFALPIEVTDEHADAPGHHVNNVVYVKWINDVALAHWNAAAPSDGRSDIHWYVVRHEIDYLREVFPGERLIARTHVGASRGARFERFVEIVRQDGSPVARARSVWAAIDARTGRPTRITDAMRAPFLRTA